MKIRGYYVTIQYNLFGGVTAHLFLRGRNVTHRVTRQTAVHAASPAAAERQIRNCLRRSK